jgi:hypothetical protein
MNYELLQLRKIIRAIRSSPQRKQAWFRQLETSLQGRDLPSSQQSLMLILDVKTRWSSTHQMLRASHHFVFTHLDLDNLLRTSFRPGIRLFQRH